MNKQGCFDVAGGRGCFLIRQGEKRDSRKRNQQRQKVRARTVRCTGETRHGTGGAGSNIHRTQTHELTERSSLGVRQYGGVGTVANWKVLAGSGGNRTQL